MPFPVAAVRGTVFQQTAAAADNNPGTTNLISWWSLDETSGTRNDSHGTNHLTDNNTVLSAAGKQSNAADFEFSNSEDLSIADNASISFGDEDYTWCAWVNLESKHTTSNRIIVKYGGSKFEYFLDHDENAAKTFRWLVSGNGTAFTSVTSSIGVISLATWYFIVAWHDAAANTINIQVNNGTVDSVAHTAGTFDGTSALHIGGEAQSGSYKFDGLMDEVALFSAVLTADERTWLYNSGAGRAYSELS